VDASAGSDLQGVAHVGVDLPNLDVTTLLVSRIDVPTDVHCQVISHVFLGLDVILHLGMLVARLCYLVPVRPRSSGMSRLPMQ
jgi:hypothetical protein